MVQSLVLLEIVSVSCFGWYCLMLLCTWGDCCGIKMNFSQVLVSVLFCLLLLNWFFVCFFVCFLLRRIQNQNHDTVSFWGFAALDICDGCISLFECVKKLFLVLYYWVGRGLKSLWLLWLNEFVLGGRIFFTSWYCNVIQCVLPLWSE